MRLARRALPALAALAGLAVLAAALAGATAFGAPPHLVSLPAAIDSDRARDLSADLLALLSDRTGETFALADHRNALTYLDELAAGSYAVVFEGPHVIGALARRESLVPVAEFSQGQSFVVVVSSAESGIYQLADLAGKPVCAGEIPDLFALSLLAAVDNPSREPVIVPVGEPRNRIRRLLGGRCRAATLKTDGLLTLEAGDGIDDLRIIYKSRELPGYAVGVSANLPEATRKAVSEALLSADGRSTTRALGAALTGVDVPLVASDPKRYAPLAALMDPYFFD